MASLKEMAAQATNPDLLLTPRINDFLLQHGGQVYSEEAMSTVWEALTTPGRKRSASFSASSAGTCLRRQELTFLGYPQKPIQPNLQMVFKIGHWLHAQTQAMLLTADLLTQIEVPLDWPKMNAKGSMDGQGFVWWTPANPAWAEQEYVVEIKTVGAHMWEKMSQMEKPKEDHLKQIHRYFLISGLRLCSYLMIDKGNQGQDGFKEIVVECDPDLLKESEDELKALNEALAKQELHPIKPGCQIGTTSEYKMCPFTGKQTGACHNTDAWAPYSG